MYKKVELQQHIFLALFNMSRIISKFRVQFKLDLLHSLKCYFMLFEDKFSLKNLMPCLRKV